MAEPQLITAVQRPQVRNYVGTERRHSGASRHDITATRLRLSALVATAATAMAMDLLDWRLPDAAIAHGLPAFLAGLPLAATVLYWFRFALMRDAYSLEIGTVVVFCGLMMGAAQLVEDHRSSFATPLAAVAAMAGVLVALAIRRPVVNTQLRSVRTSSNIALLLASTATIASVVHHLGSEAFGDRAGIYFSVSIGMVGAAAAVVLAHSAVRGRRHIVTGAASILYLASLSAILVTAGKTDEHPLALVVLLAAGSVAVLETSATELWLAFAHEERRLFDLFVLSQQQQTVLDAERRAGATKRHDQKATVIAIEGAVSALASDGSHQLDAGTRDHLATAVRAELARLRRGLEQTHLLDVVPVALRDVLSPMIVCMRSEGINVRLDIPAGMVVDTNADCLLEIVQNLVDNAATHGRNRGIVITANLNDSGFDVAVSDRGPGVPEALRDVIFERGVTSRAADHSGLGLFSANQLAQRLGGTLRVESARRGGARFVLRVSSTRQGGGNDG